MIELEMTRAEALLAFELFKENTDALLEQIMNAVEEENTQQEMRSVARKNYVLNLESEVEKLENEVSALKALIDSQNLASDSKGFKPREKKVDAPYGLKKDGTPKARPGRKVK